MTTSNDPRGPREHRPGGVLGAYLAIGIGVGTAIGVALHSIGLGIGIGLAIGVALGTAVEASQNRAGRSHEGGDDATGGGGAEPRPPVK
jgi:hypothetical protein